MYKSMRDALIAEQNRKLGLVTEEDEEEEKKKKKKKQSGTKKIFTSIGKGLSKVFSPLVKGTFSVLDILDRPRNVIANLQRDRAIKEVLDNRDFDNILNIEARRGNREAIEALQKRRTSAQELQKKLSGRGAISRGLRPKSELDKASYTDILEITRPGITENPIAKFGLDFIGNIALDPMTYIGVGALTKMGKDASRVSSAKRSGEGIKAGSKLANIAAKYGDDALNLAPTMSEQAAKGQRALLSFMGEPIIGGERAFRGLENLGAASKNTKLVQELNRVFSTKTGNKAVDEAREIGKLHEIQRSLRTQEALKDYDELRQLVDQITKETGLSTGDLVDLVEKPHVFKPQRFKIGGKVTDPKILAKARSRGPATLVRYGGKPVGKSIDKLGLAADQKQLIQDLVKKVREFNQRNLMAEQAIGLPVEALKGREIKYFPRYKTKAGKAVGTPSRKWKTAYSGLHERELKHLSVKEINELYGKGKNVFIDDPAIAQTLRNIDSARAQSNAEFLRDIIDRYGVRPETLREDLKKIGNPPELVRIAGGRVSGKMPATAKKLYSKIDRVSLEKGLKRALDPYTGLLEGTAFTPEIAEFITEYFKRQQKEELGLLKSAVKGFHGWWKPQTLFAIPSYHVRNEAGNIWNNILSDVDPRKYIDAYKIQKGKGGQMITDAGQVIDLATAGHLARTTGAQELGFYRTDFNPSNAAESVKQSKNILRQLNPFRKDNIFIRKGAKIATAIEDNARLANFLDALQKGYNPIDAAKRTNKYLFDYSDLTDAEKAIRDYAVPFYTWWRKNLPLQLEHILTTPGKFTKVKHLMDAYKNARGGPNEEYMPDWLKASMPIQVTGDEKGGKYLPLKDWLPFGDVNDIVNEPLSDILGRVSPFYKIPVELAMNKKLFDKKPIYGTHIPDEEKYGAILQYIATNLHRPTSELIRATDERRTPIERALRPVIGSLYEYREEKGIEDSVKELRTMATIYRKNGETKKADELDEEANRLAKSIGLKTRKIPSKSSSSTFSSMRDALMHEMMRR